MTRSGSMGDQAGFPGVILAGGLSSRMGFEKGMADLGGRTILEWIIDRLGDQVTRLAINANGDAGRFARYGLPVIQDGVPGRPGPLAGFLAAMEWAASLGFGTVLVVPSDTPFLPRDLAARLAAAGGAGDTVIAASAEQRHFACAYLQVEDRHLLRAHLESGGGPSVAAWLDRREASVVFFDAAPFDPFFNVNTPDDLATANRIAREHES